MEMTNVETFLTRLTFSTYIHTHVHAYNQTFISKGEKRKEKEGLS